MRANERHPHSQSQSQPRLFTLPADLKLLAVRLKNTCMALTQGHLGLWLQLWQHVCLSWPTQKHERTRLNAVECQLFVFSFLGFWGGHTSGRKRWPSLMNHKWDSLEICAAIHCHSAVAVHLPSLGWLCQLFSCLAGEAITSSSEALAGVGLEEQWVDYLSSGQCESVSKCKYRF